MNTINIAVIGAGHLGKNHVRICNSLSGCKLVAVVDNNPAKAEEFGKQYNVPYYTEYPRILDKVSAVSIVTPTSTHYRIAYDCIKRGIHTFVEKPITQTVKEGKELVALAKKYKVILQVGHIERFNPAFTAVSNDIKQPRFIESHRLSPLSFRSIDIDVVRDLMIHDIDIVLSLVNEKHPKVSATGVPVLTKQADIANARLVFPDGCVANLTASRISDKSMRKIRIFSRDTYASIDFLNHSAQVYRKSPDVPSPEKLLKNIDLSAIKDYQSMMRDKFLEVKEPEIKKVDQLETELTSFINSIQNNKRPVVSGEDGLAALIVAEEIIHQIKKSAKIK